MWNAVEYDNRPDEIDKTSSAKYVYVRKDIAETEREQDGETVTMWTAMENKVLKGDWEQYEAIMSHTTELSEVQDALVELAGLITEG